MLSGGLLPARMNKGELFYGRASYSGPDERYDGAKFTRWWTLTPLSASHHHRGWHHHPAGVQGELFGFASGGTDFNGKNAANKDLFGGGSGAGVNIQPVAFLVIKDGCVRTIQLSDSSNSIDRALTMLPELVEKLTTLVKNGTPRHPQRSPRQSNLLIQIKPQPQIFWSAVYIAAHRAPGKMQGSGAHFGAP